MVLPDACAQRLLIVAHEVSTVPLPDVDGEAMVVARAEALSIAIAL